MKSEKDFSEKVYCQWDSLFAIDIKREEIDWERNIRRMKTGGATPKRVTHFH